MKRITVITSFVLFLVLCATTSFWVLQFMKPTARKIVAPPAAKPVANVENVATLFGGALAVNTNYQLRGIVLANPQQQSLAIIAVDGAAAQAYAVDAEINPGVKLAEVRAGYVMITDNGVSKRIDLPEEYKAGNQNAAPSPIVDRPRMVTPPPAGTPARGAVGDNSIVNHRHGLKFSPEQVDAMPPNGTHPDGVNPNPPQLKPVQ
jgi:general secretion pathway protein C